MPRVRNRNHPSFWTELAGKLGPPIFAATLVACLLQGTFDPLHAVLMGVGLAFIAFDHWVRFHRSKQP